jgi:glycosyltransferase involved in cell wall biosynthesis
MKIAVFNRHFSRKAGGAESYSIALVEGLADKHEVHVFAQTILHWHPRVTYHKVPGPIHRPRWINQLVFATYTWWKTRSGFDVIHSHENTWHGQVQTVHVRPIRFHLFEGKNGRLAGWRIALRWLKIATSPRLAFYVWLEAARMEPKAGRTVVAVSALMREQTLIAYPHLPTDMPVILPGVGLPNLALSKEQAREKLGLPLQQKMILFVGNDYARKGLPALLAAMPALEANIHLLCVGSAAPVPKFQLMAAELAIAERVHFVGALTDMSLAYRAADMLVHPTLEDSFAMVVLEAMSYGLPVIVSSAKYCGISQFLQNGVNALFLDDPRDSAQLTIQINRVLTEPKLSQTLAGEGLLFARQNSWDTALHSYLDIYKKMIHEASLTHS